MKKKILLISSMLLTFILIIFVSLNNTNNENKNVLSNVEKDTEVINSNMITMMYETEAGTGIYEETKDTTWPENGYIFNENLSGCENGGELEYNSQNNTVNLLSNKSDNCYVYFDKYDGVWIDNVSVTNVTGSSVTLDISATSENGSITTYYYSLNDSEEYQETTSSPITINDLNKLTEYKISIYAIDSTNARSNIYEVIVSTTDESGPVINSVSISDITSYGFTLTVDATSDVEIERYYFYINGDGENYAGTSTTPEYTFNTLTDNSNYTIIIFAENNNGIFSNKYSISITTEETPILLADYIKSLYTSQGVNGIYYHTSSLANSAGDNSYRYSGANPDNYVCFGSDAETCPSDNLYRIIGVFGSEVKLIKWDYANSNLLGTSGAYSDHYYNVTNEYLGSHNKVDAYLWNNNTKNNKWEESNLNSTNLNNIFLNTFNLNYKNKIANTIWYVSGYRTYDATSKKFYNAESIGTTWSGKIGLMYVSDYGYAASQNSWSTNMYSYGNNSIKKNNWLYMGMHEWTISPISTSTSSVYYINADGRVVDDGGVNNSYANVRPCFYLKPEVTYISGNGSKNSPFRIDCPICTAD